MVSKLLTLVLLVGLLAFMITQVILPAFTGTPFFTAFRKDTYGKKWRKHKNADGALEQKLAAWVKAQEAWSKAIAEYKGAWVPTVQMGDQKGSGNGANALMDLLTTKTAKDLALDFRPSK